MISDLEQTFFNTCYILFIFNPPSIGRVAQWQGAWLVYKIRIIHMATSNQPSSDYDATVIKRLQVSLAIAVITIRTLTPPQVRALPRSNFFLLLDRSLEGENVASSRGIVKST